MKINISAPNIKITSGIREYVQGKLGSLEKYSSVFKKNENKKTGGKETIEAWVTLKKAEDYHHVAENKRETQHAEEGGKFKVEAEFLPPGKRIVADGYGYDIYAAINDVRDKLKREFRQYSDKQNTLFRKGARFLKKIRNYSSQLFKNSDHDQEEK